MKTPLEFYKNKRVFITGHTGFKGSWLCAWLQELGAEVMGYALLPHTTPNHFDLLDLQTHSIFGNIKNFSKLQKSLKDFQPEIIFHLAAQPLVRKSYTDPIDTYKTNVLGTLNLLQASRKISSIRSIINITTDKVYENKEWVWGYRENDPLGGYDPYSSSKACSEILSASFRSSFFNINDFNKTHQTLIATARAGNVIGGGDWSADRLIPDIIRGMQKKSKIIIRNPQATRPWQHVLEPLYGYLLLGIKLYEGKTQFAQSFNFGPNAKNNLSVAAMLEIIKKNWNISYQITPNPHFSHEANLLMLDSSKAHSFLHWQGILDAQKSIQMTLQWYEKNLSHSYLMTWEQIKSYSDILKTTKGKI
ncbi:CDP-glucose 4,6-dehydratase [Helicobacter sp. 11S03491-1]|uniref:CDP-glucose 4,6-dehydratase n=1 Tax=Helicobacter sp. 11S03491-1 TaxID=1476196 RepID=UPI000BA7642D|nr:CDP-glucose 4,6-dehydratase [Helicobacter sp. 11S03491-1]PAF41223.1 CDP-glucose 4,6-dehydratase [Helicobacter sp. 11S03491-1]